MKRSYQVSIIILAGLIFYFNSLFNGFVWDDEFLVRDNPYIRSIVKAVNYAFSRDIFPKELFITQPSLTAGSNYYRPIQVISYAVDYKLWGVFAFGYHLTNLVLHIINGLLVYLVISLLQPVSLISFITALFFVVHPIHIEAVTYISGRADLLAGFFILSAFYFFIRYRRVGVGIKQTTSEINKSNWLFELAAFCFFLAMLCKEYAIILPILFLCFDYSFGKLNRATLKPYGLFFTLLVIYCIFRISALEFPNSLPGAQYSTLLLEEFPVRLLSFLKSIIVYFVVLFVPVNLHMQRTFLKPSSFFDIWVISALSLLLIVSFFTFRQRKKSPLVFFLFGWFISLIFFQSYIFIPGFMMSEHFLYLASIAIFFGFGIFFNFLFSKFKVKREKRRLIAFLLSALVVFYGSLTAIHNLNWKNNVTFYKWTLKFSPNSLRVHMNLANEYILLNRFDLALDEYRTAKLLLSKIDINRYKEKPQLFNQLQDAIALTYYNLGVLYADRREFKEAEEQYRSALEILPNYNVARNNLACLLSKTNRPQEAIEELEVALRIDPNDMKAYYNLGAILANIGEKEKARRVWSRALKIDQNSEKIKAALAELLRK